PRAEHLAERLYELPDWPSRSNLLDVVFRARLDQAKLPKPSRPGPARPSPTAVAPSTSPNWLRNLPATVNTRRAASGTPPASHRRPLRACDASNKQPTYWKQAEHHCPKWHYAPATAIKPTSIENSNGSQAPPLTNTSDYAARNRPTTHSPEQHVEAPDKRSIRAGHTIVS